MLFSERLAPLPDGSFNLCRAASLAMMYDAATNGDWTTSPNGSRWGRTKIKDALEDMRKSAGPDPEGDGYNQSHQAAFLRGVGAPEDAWQQFNTFWPNIADALRNGWTVELAGNVKHVPADSPLRKYVNPVAHDIILIDIVPDRVLFIDPMTPHGASPYVRSAPISHFQQFGSEFRTSAGNYTAGRMKRGKYSDVAQAKAQEPADVARLRDKIEVQQQELAQQDRLIESLNIDLADTEKDLNTAERKIEEARPLVTTLRDVLQ
jgi:hypothetical protein